MGDRGEWFEGIGKVWLEGGRWHFITVYGSTGTARGKTEARSRMETRWLTESKKHAGIEDHAGYRLTGEEKSMWAAQEKMILRGWGKDCRDVADFMREQAEKERTAKNGEWWR